MSEEQVQKNFISDQYDEVRTVGVRAKGYGLIAKYVMLDPRLSCEAKGIYAYFCAYTGAGKNQLFPGRDTIISNLGINKDTYYKHFNMLCNCGYISVTRCKSQNSRFAHNIYTINGFPVDIEKSCDGYPVSEYIKDALTLVLQAKDISAAGYGIMPKLVAEAVLPLKAKAVYAYLCAFSGAGFNTAPERDVVIRDLNISKNTFGTLVKELETCGYITRARRKEAGRFAGMTYCIVQTILGVITSSPQPKTSDTEIEDDVSPQTKISDMENRDAVLPQPKLSDTEISDISPLQPKISDMKISEISVPYPSISDTEISDNNSNTDNINFSLNQSLYHNNNQDNTGHESDRLIDLIETDEVLNEIYINQKLPVARIKTFEQLHSVLKYLTEWDIRTNKSYYLTDGDIKVRAYKLFLDVLCSILSDQNDSDYVYALKLINTVWLTFSNFGFSDSNVSLGDLPDLCIDKFVEICGVRKVSNYKAYMRKIIMTKLSEYGMHSVEDF